MTKTIIAKQGLDITEGKAYPIFEIEGREYFKDDVGDERLVSYQLRKGGRYGSVTQRDLDRGGFVPGDRVEATGRLFQGDVPSGTRGVVIPPRDPGVNVKWDNGYSFHNGSATVCPKDIRKVEESRVTPQSEAKYLLRILRCPANPDIEGSFVERICANGSVNGNTSGNTRDSAQRLSYDELVKFLREREEDTDHPHRKEAEFEVVLDFIKTGAVVAPPEPERGNNGWTVGTKLRCDFSGHPRILPRGKYVVRGTDGDGHELISPEHDASPAVQVPAKYGRSERNEYSVISEGK